MVSRESNNLSNGSSPTVVSHIPKHHGREIKPSRAAQSIYPHLGNVQVKKQSKTLKWIPAASDRASTKRIKIVAEHNATPPAITSGTATTRASARPATPSTSPPPPSPNIRRKDAAGTRANERALQAGMQEALIPLLDKRLHAHGANGIEEIAARAAVRRRLAVAQRPRRRLRMRRRVDAGGPGPAAHGAAGD